QSAVAARTNWRWQWTFQRAGQSDPTDLHAGFCVTHNQGRLTASLFAVGQAAACQNEASRVPPLGQSPSGAEMKSPLGGLDVPDITCPIQYQLAILRERVKSLTVHTCYSASRWDFENFNAYGLLGHLAIAHVIRCLRWLDGSQLVG